METDCSELPMLIVLSPSIFDSRIEIGSMGEGRYGGSSLLLHCVANEKRKSTQFKHRFSLAIPNKISALVVVGASPHDPLGLCFSPRTGRNNRVPQWRRTILARVVRVACSLGLGYPLRRLNV